jgi:hypothetical protein
MSTALVVSDLPQFLLDMIASPPRAGDGVHLWIFRVARQLHAHRSEEDIFNLLKASLEDCGRDVPDQEINDAICNSKAGAWRPRKDGGPIMTPPHTKWSPPDFDAIDSIVRAGGDGIHSIVEQSPVLFFDDQSHAEEIIDVVFPANPLLCCGLSKYKFETRRREVWRGRLSTLPLVVPNPMLAYEGMTQKGTPSSHTKQATARRVYQVIEFDFAEKCRDQTKDSIFAPLVRGWRADGILVTDACAALILNFKEFLPTLVTVCHSGGKSVHAWWRVFDLDTAAQWNFMNRAVSMGADPATWVKSQFVRIPDGLRDNAVRQTAYYLDPGEAVRA